MIFKLHICTDADRNELHHGQKHLKEKESEKQHTRNH